MKPMKPHPFAQAGFSLLEILVAIVILSLGMLGLAGLQAASLRNNQTAYYRSVAAQQTYDMADRIRANQAGVASGQYDALTATIPTDPHCVETGVACSAANMAVSDHYQWNTNNSLLLPGGVGTVDCVAGPGVACSNTANALREFDITVQWTERREDGAQITQSFVTRVSP